jgi:hypothetical protein
LRVLGEKGSGEKSAPTAALRRRGVAEIERRGPERPHNYA